MDYLFFDIECCDGNHMCSFGYVIVNDRFEIVDKADMLIDPQMPFKLGRDNFDPFIKLAYSKEEFCSHAPFDEAYPAIRALLTAPNRRLFGHSVASDIKYIDIACERYGKPALDIAAYDTQKIYKRVVGDKDMSSLENIMAKLSVDTTHLSAHKSCDDAEMTMLAVKALCARADCDIESFCATYGNCIIDRRNMAVAELNVKMKKVIARSKRVCPESRQWEKFRLSDWCKLDHADQAEWLVERIYGAGYALTLNGDKFDYYIAKSGEHVDADDIPSDVKVITFDDFLDRIGVEPTADGKLIRRDADGGTNSLRGFFEQAASRSNVARRNKNKR